MKRTARVVAVVMAGLGLAAFTAAPAVCSDEFCPMGGTQVKAEVVAAKAVAWGKGRAASLVADEGSDSWSVLVLSVVDKDVAVLLSQGSVFFGVAGAGGREVDARTAEKVFGRDLRRLRDVMRKELGELWKSGAVKIDGGDVQKLADAAGLGALQKQGGGWVLATQDCTGLDIDASSLK